MKSRVIRTFSAALIVMMLWLVPTAALAGSLVDHSWRMKNNHKCHVVKGIKFCGVVKEEMPPSGKWQGNSIPQNCKTSACHVLQNGAYGNPH